MRIFQKLSRLSLSLFFCLALFGCPYESQVPISLPTIPVDARLLGNWQSKDEVYNTYTIKKASGMEYAITQKNITGTFRFRAFLSELRGNVFMNVYSDSTRKYYLYKVKIQPDAEKLTLTPVADDLPAHFSNIDALREYVEKNMNLQSFYREDDQAEFEKRPDPTAFKVP